MKRTLWTVGTKDSPVENHLGVRLGRLALGCRHRCSSSSDASLSIPQHLQSLPLFKSAMESFSFDLEDFPTTECQAYHACAVSSSALS